jgi:hypothetical protein
MSASVQVLDSNTSLPIATAQFGPPPGIPATVNNQPTVAASNNSNGNYTVSWNESPGVDPAGSVICSASSYYSLIMTLVDNMSYVARLLPKPVQQQGAPIAFTTWNVNGGGFGNTFIVVAGADTGSAGTTYGLSLTLNGQPIFTQTGYLDQSTPTIYLTLDQNGVFDLEAVVSDSVDSAQRGQTLVVNCPPPKLGFTYNQAVSLSPAAAGAAVFDYSLQIFTGNIAGVSVFGAAMRSFTIDWGDGESDDLTAVALGSNGTFTSAQGHIYKTSGDYVVTATVIDFMDQKTTASVNLTWRYLYQAPSAQFGPVATSSSTNGDTASFSGTVTQNDDFYPITKLQMDWGDGTVDNLVFTPNPGAGVTVGFVATHHYAQAFNVDTQHATATLIMTSDIQTSKASITFSLPTLIPIPKLGSATLRSGDGIVTTGPGTAVSFAGKGR